MSHPKLFFDGEENKNDEVQKKDSDQSSEDSQDGQDEGNESTQIYLFNLIYF